MKLRTVLYEHPAVTAGRVWTTMFGDMQQKERFNALPRANYAYGLLRAGRVAQFFGKRGVTACEFGVATGAGLRAMASLAERFGRELGIRYRVVGFDTGAGLPDIHGVKDHPELWSSGDFPMMNRDDLVRSLEGKAELVFGDIEQTVDAFRQALTPEAPLGFVSVDVDIYSGTRSALRCLTGPPEIYNPAVSMYFDDVGFFFANSWCGELAAIAEFNAEHPTRKIDLDRSLPGDRPVQHAIWYRHMYACHILDHPARQTPRPRTALDLRQHDDFLRKNAIY